MTRVTVADAASCHDDNGDDIYVCRYIYICYSGFPSSLLPKTVIILSSFSFSFGV